MEVLAMKEPTKYIRCPRYEGGKRRCHDCGKPTTDYRCPACRRKGALRNQVDPETLGGGSQRVTS